MARRRKRDDDFIGVVAQLAGVLILLSLISPQVRQIISTAGFIAICLVGVGVLGLIGFGVYRLATRSKPSTSDDAFILSAHTDGPKAAGEVSQIDAPAQNQPQTTAEILEQLRSIDWFQFEKLVALAYRKLG